MTTASPRPLMRWKRYGLWEVLAGFLGIAVALWLILGTYKVAAESSAVLGPVTTAIAGLGGAFFGINLGQAVTAQAEKKAEAAEKKKDEAQERAEMFASALDSATAAEVRGAFRARG